LSLDQQIPLSPRSRGGSWCGCQKHDVGLGLSAERIDVFANRARSWQRILAGLPEDEQAKPAPDHDPRIAGGNTTANVYHFDLAWLTVRA
jgi:hypothetical protein